MKVSQPTIELVHCQSSMCMPTNSIHCGLMCYNVKQIQSSHWKGSTTKRRCYNGTAFSNTDDILKSHWKVPDNLGHWQHVGLKWEKPWRESSGIMSFVHTNRVMEHCGKFCGLFSYSGLMTTDCMWIYFPQKAQLHIHDDPSEQVKNLLSSLQSLM